MCLSISHTYLDIKLYDSFTYQPMILLHNNLSRTVQSTYFRTHWLQQSPTLIFCCWAFRFASTFFPFIFRMIISMLVFIDSFPLFHQQASTFVKLCKATWSSISSRNYLPGSESWHAKWLVVNEKLTWLSKPRSIEYRMNWRHSTGYDVQILGFLDRLLPFIDKEGPFITFSSLGDIFSTCGLGDGRLLYLAWSTLLHPLCHLVPCRKPGRAKMPSYFSVLINQNKTTLN